MSEKEKQNILEMDEVSTYLFIDECGAFIFKMGHGISKNLYEKWNVPTIIKDIENVQKVQQFAVDNLGRFGIDPESTKDKLNGDYWKWYRFWGKWKTELEDKDWQIVTALLKNGKSIEKYLPTKTWKD